MSVLQNHKNLLLHWLPWCGKSAQRHFLYVAICSGLIYMSYVMPSMLFIAHQIMHVHGHWLEWNCWKIRRQTFLLCNINDGVVVWIWCPWPSHAIQGNSKYWWYLNYFPSIIAIEWYIHFGSILIICLMFPSDNGHHSIWINTFSTQYLDGLNTDLYQMGHLLIGKLCL